MFLSKLELSIRQVLVRRDLASPYDMHKTLLSRGFDGLTKEQIGRVLFRVDTDYRSKLSVLLVQSETRPDWSKLPEGYLASQADSKTFDPQFHIGQKLRFRLRANPTKRVAAKNERLGSVMLGKRVGLTTETEQIKWLLHKAEGGFTLPGGWVPAKHPETEEPILLPNFRVDVVPEGRIRNGKVGHREGAFIAIRFEGVLNVADPVAFRTILENGIGTAKGYGFGLLSVAPA